MTQPRILLITRNLPPLVGGMERLNWHMADELSKYAEVKVIGPKGSAALKPERVSLTEAPQPTASIDAFKQRHGLIGKKILLSVGRLTTCKGLREFVERALPNIVQAEPSPIKNKPKSQNRGGGTSKYCGSCLL